MPSKINTCGEYMVVVCLTLACFSKEYTGISATLLKYELALFPAVQEGLFSPLLDILQSLYQKVEINGLRGVKVKLIPECSRRLLWCQRLIERVLLLYS